MVFPTDGQDALQRDLAEGVLVLKVLEVPDQAREDQREKVRRLLHRRFELPPIAVHDLRLPQPLRPSQLRAYGLPVLQALPGHAVDHVPDRRGVAAHGAPLRQGLLDHGAGGHHAPVEEGIQRDLQPLAREPPEVEDAAHDRAGKAMRLVLHLGPELCEDLLVPIQDLAHVRGRLRAVLKQRDREELRDGLQRPGGGRRLSKLILLTGLLHGGGTLCLGCGCGCGRLGRLLLRRLLLRCLRSALLLGLRSCGLVGPAALLAAALGPLLGWGGGGLLAAALGPFLSWSGGSPIGRRGVLLLGFLLWQGHLQEPAAVLQHLLHVRVLDADKAKDPRELGLGLSWQGTGSQRLRRHVHVDRLGQPVQQVLVEGQPLQPLERPAQEALRRHRDRLACERAPVGGVGVVHEVVGKGLGQHLQALLIQLRSLSEQDAIGLLDELHHGGLLLSQALEEPRVEERQQDGAGQPQHLAEDRLDDGRVEVGVQQRDPEDLLAALVDVAAEHLDRRDDVVLQHPAVVLREFVVRPVVRQSAAEEAGGHERDLQPDLALLHVLGREAQRLQRGRLWFALEARLKARHVQHGLGGPAGLLHGAHGGGERLQSVWQVLPS
mmetsp:Transcript_87218/g.260179  ORF Transcript_87218/g.260179 Transcript_87218/m.260179 type:complete len:606 (+) Transcript_87218:139-1956(+)